MFFVPSYFVVCRNTTENKWLCAVLRHGIGDDGMDAKGCSPEKCIPPMYDRHGISKLDRFGNPKAPPKKKGKKRKKDDRDVESPAVGEDSAFSNSPTVRAKKVDF